MANFDFCDKDNMVAYLQKSEGSKGFHQIMIFHYVKGHIRYALTESPTIYVSLIEQFWQTASASTLENGDMEITATIDGKVKKVETLESDLKQTKLTYGAAYTKLIMKVKKLDGLLKEIQKPRKAKRTNEISQSNGPIHLVTDETVYKECEDILERAATIITSLEAEQDGGNINRTQSMATLNESFTQRTDLGNGPRINILGSGVDIMKLMELMEHCTKLSELNPNLTSLYQMANLDFCDKHNMVTYLQKSEGSEGFHQIIDFLMTSHISTLENGDMEITTTIDEKVKVVSEASIRRYLKLEDSDGISTLPTLECPILIT
ncbi:hypothetical protein Tco_0373334 [Tanacetum coccineum]